MASAPQPRHPACTGCCQCLPLPLPIVPPPPPVTPPWLTDEDDYFRPLDYFTADIVHNPALSRRERVDAARAFYRRWGANELRRALREADRIRELPSELREVIDKVAA